MEKLIAVINVHTTTASKGIGTLDSKALDYGIMGLISTRHAIILSFCVRPTWITPFSRHMVGRSQVLVKASGTIWFH